MVELFALSKWWLDIFLHIIQIGILIKMLNDKDFDLYFNKTKKMLLAELHGKRYASNELDKLRKLAAEHNSDFYSLGLEQFEVINNYNADLTNISFISDSNEFDKLAKSILGYDNPYENLTRNQILDYFFNLPDNVAITEVEGDSMIDAGIEEGDNLLYIKTKKANNGDMIIAILDGKKYVKRLKQVENNLYLVSENKDYPEFKIGITNNFVILGKVMQILKNIKPMNDY